MGSCARGVQHVNLVAKDERQLLGSTAQNHKSRSYTARYAIAALRGFLSPGRGSTNIFAEVRTPYRAWPSDIDLMGHINNGRYLTLLDSARMYLSVYTGIARLASQNKWVPLVVASTATYKKEILPFSKFQITTRICAFDKKWFYIEHRMEAGNTLHVAATIKMVWKTKEGRTVYTDEFMEAAGLQSKRPSAPSPFSQEFIEMQQRVDRAGEEPWKLENATSESSA